MSAVKPQKILCQVCEKPFHFKRKDKVILHRIEKIEFNFHIMSKDIVSILNYTEHSAHINCIIFYQLKGYNENFLSCKLCKLKANSYIIEDKQKEKIFQSFKETYLSESKADNSIDIEKCRRRKIEVQNLCYY